MKKIKILVLTDAVWNINNNVGNSFSNIFAACEEFEIYNISCQTGEYDKKNVKRCFQISEKEIIRSWGNKDINVGKEVTYEKVEQRAMVRNSKLMNYIKVLRLSIFFVLRDLIWATKRWKSKNLDSFLNSIQPDVIFLQLQGTKYLNDLAVYVQKKVKKPMVAYAWDDVYTLKQFAVSPLYWLDRIIQRNKIKRSVQCCKMLYAICEKQRYEYEKIFQIPCHLLYKGYSYKVSEKSERKTSLGHPLRIVYAGTIGDGRFNTLVNFVKALRRINEKCCLAKLDVYTMNPLTNHMRKKIEVANSSYFRGSISNQELGKVIENADIVLHVEPFSLRGGLKVAMSFSTKLVDYFYKGKCIFSVGSARSSSIQYLLAKDAAVVCTKRNMIEKSIMQLVMCQDKINEYENKAYQCGKKHHNISDIQQELKSDLRKIIEG